jgi:hypothetical protein
MIMKKNIKILVGLLSALIVGIFVGGEISNSSIIKQISVPVPISISVSEVSESFWISTFSVTAGGIIAAWVAYLLNIAAKRVDRKNSQVRALTEALFIQSTQLNIISYYKAELDKFNNELSRILSLKTFVPPDCLWLKQDFSSLIFLTHSEDPLIPAKMVQRDIEFEQLIAIVKDHREFVRDVLENVIQSTSLAGTTHTTVDEVRKKIGTNIYDTALAKSDVMYKSVNDVYEGLVRDHKNLTIIAKKIYSKEHFLIHELIGDQLFSTSKNL